MSAEDWFLVGLPFGPVIRRPAGLAPDEFAPLQEYPSLMLNFGEGDELDGLVGLLIEVEGGRQYLIGDINRLGGCCDDCRDVASTEMVIRARRVWRKGQLA